MHVCKYRYREKIRIKISPPTISVFIERATMIFVITSAGLAAAAAAGSGGPAINITNFSVGSGYGYTPTSSDTALHGQVLYNQAINSYSVLASNTVQYQCVINDSIGDFVFGECGLYLASGQLFALGSLAALQSKIHTVTGTAGNTITITAKLVLAQIGSSISFPINNQPLARMIQISSVNQLLAPILADSNSYLTSSTDPSGVIITAFRQGDYLWSFPSYTQTSTVFTTTSGSTTTSLSCIGLGNVAAVPVASKYILQFTSGLFAGNCRLVTTSTPTTLTWDSGSPTSSAVATGTTFTVYECTNNVLQDLQTTTNSPTTMKLPVRAAAVSNIVLSGLQTIDGVSLNSGDSVLLTAQSAGSANGVYTVSTSTWIRRVDLNQTIEMLSGIMIPVTEGILYSGQTYMLRTLNPIVLETTSLVFSYLTTMSGNTAAQFDNTSNFATTAFVQKAGLHFQNTSGIGIAANTTMTLANSGHWAEIQATGLTITLPALSTTFAGLTTYTFKSLVAGTIKGSGTENIAQNGANANTMATVAGETTTIVSNVSNWYVLADGLGSVAVQTMLNNYGKLTGATFTGPITADSNVKMWMGGGSIISNTVVGNSSLYSNTSGVYNTVYGSNVLPANTTGSYNVAIGNNALGGNTTASNTVAIGVNAFANSNAGSGTAIGTNALYTSTTGASNSAFGSTSLYDVTTGSNNTAVGNNSGRGITTGSGNTILGPATGLASGLTNNVILANNVGIQAQFDGTAWTLQGVVTITPGTAAAHAATIGQVPGIGQTWQNMTGSRSASTNYLNSTGKMIAVAACASTASGGSQAFMTITPSGASAVSVSGGSAAGGYAPYIYAEIPPGATYQLTGGGGGVSTWFERR